jgi:hypothetical protein
MAPVDGGPAESWRLQATRCSGEGSGSEVVGWRTGFGVAKGRGLTREACPRWRGMIVEEEGRQAGVVVTGRVGVVREEFLGGTKLGVGYGFWCLLMEEGPHDVAGSA